MPASSNSRNTASLRIAVIGGGMVGLSCALELKRRGASVSVYERGVELGAGVTHRSAGMLGAAFDWAVEADQLALAALARHAGEIWPEFASRIEQLGGGPVEMSTKGAIVVARDVAEVEWIDALAAACQARGLPVKRLSAIELKQQERAITGAVRGGLLLPGDAQVDPPALVQRMGAALARVGVSLKLGRAVERVVTGPGFAMLDGERFDRVVLATGVSAAPKFVDRAGHAFNTRLPELVPVKGQMLALAQVDGAPVHVIHTRDLYLAPKSRWILVGATVERGRSDTGVDRAVIEDMRAKAIGLVGVLGKSPEVSAWAGVRPGTPDDAPLVGEAGIPGVFAVLGCYRNGILFAPAVAEIIASQILDGKVSAMAAAFDPLRFNRG
jgi:glycine oxidase